MTSSFAKVFEEEASSWEEKLNRILTLFDVWIDVQRRWVYLEGIFTGSADIPHLLPVETQRFNSISSEFLMLMKKVGPFHAPFTSNFIFNSFRWANLLLFLMSSTSQGVKDLSKDLLIC